MITLAKRDTLHAAVRQQRFSIRGRREEAVRQARHAFRAAQGGYTRIVKLGFRKGDGAEQVMLELVGSELVKRAADRAKRRNKSAEAMREGNEGEEGAAAKDQLQSSRLDY